jgi:hypothetical protein
MEENVNPAAPDPEKVMADIRCNAMVRAEGDLVDALDGIARAVEALRASGARVEQIAAELGRPPAAPATLRGRLGGLLIRWLDRLFWWQSAALRELGGALTERQKQETAVWNALARAAITLRQIEHRRRGTIRE